MFIFTSAIFFLIYFSFIVNTEKPSAAYYRDLSVTTIVQSLKDTLPKIQDSTKKIDIKNTIDNLDNLFPVISKPISGFRIGYDTSGPPLPKTVPEYDSIQQTLTSEKRDNFFVKILNRKSIQKREGGKLAETIFAENVVEHLKKTAPQVLFISLPLIALLLKLLYARKKHPWLYVDHLIFLVYVFTAVYIIMLVKFGFDGIYNRTGFQIFNWLSIGILGYALIYPIIAMYRFYGQGFFKTLIKYFILVLLALFEISLLVAASALITFLMV